MVYQTIKFRILSFSSLLSQLSQVRNFPLRFCPKIIITFVVSLRQESYCPWSHGLPRKALSQYGGAAKDHLPRVSRKSRLSTDDKGDNEMIPEAVHISPGIYLNSTI